MNIEKIIHENVNIAVVHSDEKVITSLSSALDLMMDAKYAASSTRLAIDKALVADEFFILSTGLAGEILQKFINYHVKAAFYGDFSHYTSKPLKDFIYESNQGNDFFFAATLEDAVRVLANAK